MADRPSFGSLFAGIGGLDLGLERAGMRCMWQVEIDDYANRVLAKHWPDVVRCRDVRECGAHNLAPVDLICGGFPCQDVSLAGKRAGLEGKRTTLWSEFARIIGELKPRWVLAENVPGLLSSDDGRFFGNVLRDLAACGYDAEWDCIPAASVGAPHRRDRVFVVAYPKLYGLASPARPRCLARMEQQQGWPEEQAGVEQSARGDTRPLISRDVADATGRRAAAKEQPGQLRGTKYGREDVADAHEPELAQREDAKGLRQLAATTGSRQWAVEPNVGRVANGVPARVDRLRCLGNAVVPQVAEWIGRQIISHETMS